jgi:hypothetical protein
MFQFQNLPKRLTFRTFDIRNLDLFSVSILEFRVSKLIAGCCYLKAGGGGQAPVNG